MVDRALRHLLTDVTGNTHRSEFCVDKLYSPDSLRGRLGLLELRGFEMPPNAEMALVQALLIRTVLARCAEQPYRAPLIRWGARLHEQYLLPHHVAADLADVAADLRRHGFVANFANAKDHHRNILSQFNMIAYPACGSNDIARRPAETYQNQVWMLSLGTVNCAPFISGRLHAVAICFQQLLYPIAGFLYILYDENGQARIISYHKLSLSMVALKLSERVDISLEKVSVRAPAHILQQNQLNKPNHMWRSAQTAHTISAGAPPKISVEKIDGDGAQHVPLCIGAKLRGRHFERRDIVVAEIPPALALRRR